MRTEIIDTPRILNCSDDQTTNCIMAKKWYSEAVVKRTTGELTKKQFKEFVSLVERELIAATSKQHREVHHER